MIPRKSRSHSFKSGSPQEPFDASTCDPEPRFDIPELPEDLSDLPDAELMVLLSQHTQWQNYFDALVVEAGRQEKLAELHLNEVKAKAMIGEGKLNDKRAQRDADAEVLQANTNAINAWAHRKALEVAVENRDRAGFVLSRELSRRIGRDPMNRRVDRWTP